MNIDMYSEKVADVSALIREHTGTEYFHYFADNPEKALEQFIAMLDQAEEKGRLAAQPVVLSDEQILDIRNRVWEAVVSDDEYDETDIEFARAILAAKEQA